MRDSSMSSENGSVSKAAGVVGFFTLLSRILGLVRDMVIAALFGTGMVVDAFIVALRIPNLLRRLFAEGSLTISFIPVFTEYLANKGRRDAFELARAAFTLLTLILACVTILGIVFSPWLVRLQAFGFGGEGVKYELTVLLTRITFPYIFLISLVAFFMGILNSLRRFGAPAAAPIFLNVGIIGAAYFLSPFLDEPIVGLAVGVVIGGLLQVVLQLPWIFREGLTLLPLWRPRHPAIKRISLLMLPAVFGSAVYQLNAYIGTLLASFLPEGSVSWLYYADRLVQFPLGVFAIAISTAALPSLSTQVAGKDLGRFGETLGYALRLVFFISFPSMVGLIVLGEPIISVLFERGEFGSLATTMTNKALFTYTLGLWAFSGIRVVVAGFYALQDTKTPVKVAALAFVANLVLSLLLMGPLKHAGIALALSLASGIQFCLLMALLYRRLHVPRIGPIVASAARSAFAALCMGAGILVLRRIGFMVQGEEGLGVMILRLLLEVALGAGLYFAVAAALGSRELASLKEMVRRPSANRKPATRSSSDDPGDKP